MPTFGPPFLNWDGGVNSYGQKQAVADFYRLTSTDAGPNGTGITAIVGNQSNGYQIAASFNWFTSVPSGGAAVLPETTQPVGLGGLFLIIVNSDVNALAVYPSPADLTNSINNQPANNPVNVSGGSYAIFQCFQPGFWVKAGG